MNTRRTGSKLVLSWLLSGSAYLAAGCSSGDFKNEETVAHQTAAIVMCTNNPADSTGGLIAPSPAWWSLGGGNFKPYADASNDLVCGVSVSDPGQVHCSVPSGAQGELTSKITNWGVPHLPSGETAPIRANATPIAVALRKWTEPPWKTRYRPGGAHYNLYVLFSDSYVFVTNGDSDHFYEGENFKSYLFYQAPTAWDGENLTFKKIIVANEDFALDPNMEPAAIYALTNDNRLFYKTDTMGSWMGFDNNVQDMGHLPGHGMTILYTDGTLTYRSLDFRTWNGTLPKPTGFNITAVGGTYALTDAGCGGACADNMSTFCAGDDDRILHFNWSKWKWERLQDQLAPYAAQYYPMEPVYVCPNCSPQWGVSIVDPHGLGSNASASFDLGPFVYWTGGQRVRFYNMKTALQGEVHQCAPQASGTCSGPCAMQTDGTPCPGNVPSVCFQKVCQPCGAIGGRACPEQACNGGGVASESGSCAAPPSYPANRVFNPSNSLLNTPCTKSNGVVTQLTSRCNMLPATCGYLYCL